MNQIALLTLLGTKGSTSNIIRSGRAAFAGVLFAVLPQSGPTGHAPLQVAEAPGANHRGVPHSGGRLRPRLSARPRTRCDARGSRRTVVSQAPRREFRGGVPGVAVAQTCRPSGAVGMPPTVSSRASRRWVSSCTRSRDASVSWRRPPAPHRAATACDWTVGRLKRGERTHARRRQGDGIDRHGIRLRSESTGRAVGPGGTVRDGRTIIQYMYNGTGLNPRSTCGTRAVTDAGHSIMPPRGTPGRSSIFPRRCKRGKTARVVVDRPNRCQCAGVNLRCSLQRKKPQ